MYGFSLMWTHRCAYRISLRKKDFWHVGQMYDFSLVWILRCLIRLYLSMYVFAHDEHAYGFSLVFVWNHWCRSKRSFRKKDFSHSSQMYTFCSSTSPHGATATPCAENKWLFKAFESVKKSSHSTHSWSLKQSTRGPVAMLMFVFVIVSPLGKKWPTARDCLCCWEVP